MPASHVQLEGAALQAAPGASDLRASAALLLRECRDRGISFGTAESCTGGLAAQAVTALPGASEAFCGAVVSYSNDVKRRLLGVPEETLASHGAVSAETAIAMADGCRRALRCDAALSITGIAGPGGAVPGKPVGTVFAATSVRGKVTAAFEMRWPESLGRDGIRVASAATALDALARAVAAP